MKHSPSVPLPLKGVCSLPPKGSQQADCTYQGDGRREQRGQGEGFRPSSDRWERMSNRETQF